MSEIDFLSVNHKKIVRDYLARVNDNEFPKSKAAELSKKWGYDYWDGNRKICYGGYKYDSRWKHIAKSMIEHYKLKDDARILEIGCGKGFLLYEFLQELPNATIQGIDISNYAIENCKEEVSQYLHVGNAISLPYNDNSFDFVISINTLHNLYCYELYKALKEIQRVANGNKYICVESYRNEVEKTNLLYWQVTCEAFNTPEEWLWWFNLAGYTGDYSFIYFE